MSATENDLFCGKQQPPVSSKTVTFWYVLRGWAKTLTRCVIVRDVNWWTKNFFWIYLKFQVSTWNWGLIVNICQVNYSKSLIVNGSWFCVCVVYCCFSESHRPLVTQRSLIPVVHQLDSCQSEAVVGSSSDVASTSRSRHMSSDIEDHSSPATSPEPEADSVAPAKRPTPRGLVDALSRYFTPTDKRRSRVSLNALPHASPRSLLSSDSQSLTSAADTTHTDDTLPTMLPPKCRYRKKSESIRSSSWKRDNVHKTWFSRKSGAADLQPGSCDSPTSELSPGMCLPSESKPEVLSDATCLKMSSKEAVNSETAVAAETSVKEDMEQLSDNKQRKRRRTQLSSLQDSLSQYFSAEGERKRTPAQYADREFLFETYQPLDYHAKHVKRHRTSARPESGSLSQHDEKQVEVIESPVAAATASWPSACYRLSNYHSPGYHLCAYYC